MLALKLGLSLVSTPILGGWSPDDEASLVAWYQNQVGITLNGSDVSQWDDSSSNSYDMVQATATEQPAYSGGVLTFVSADKNNLQTSGTQISLTADFTVGLRINTSTTNGTFLADNTSAGELFKYNSASKITTKIAGSGNTDLDLDSGTFGDDYLVITRVSSVLTLWKNGVAQTGTTPTLAGTALVDAIGIRRTDINAFEGTIKEIQIYSSSSADLTANINDRLSTL
ncbi:MAG TPA: hypothetical protein DCS66_20560 [Flavobacteriaceae bacterium]|nr:hypothetical protein [Flavobacteriaceae bacterium]